MKICDLIMRQQKEVSAPQVQTGRTTFILQEIILFNELPDECKHEKPFSIFSLTTDFDLFEFYNIFFFIQMLFSYNSIHILKK